MIISSHIPKTAGTTLGAMFDVSTNKRVMFDYDPNYANAASPQPEIRDHADFILWFFQVIHGHFHYTKYASLYPNARFVSCVRHPIDRVISQYFHLGMLPDTQKDWRTDDIRSGRMDVVEFAQSDFNIVDAMSVHLAGREVELYDHIFVTESLELSCRLFEEKFGFKFTTPPQRLNTSEGRRLSLPEQSYENIVFPDDAQRNALFNLCPADVELYERAKDAFLR